MDPNRLPCFPIVKSAGTAALLFVGWIPDVMSAPEPLIFSPPVKFTAGTGTSALATGDVNGDGHLDLIVANGRSNDVSVLLGNGKGAFVLANNFTVGEAPASLGIADLNGDSKLDLVVSNFGHFGFGPFVVNASVSVLLGDGRGSFLAVESVPFFGPGGPGSIKVSDLNGDGKPDFAVAINPTEENVGVFVGNGDGTFLREQSVGTFGWGLNDVALVDLNRDGNQDLAVAQRGCCQRPIFGNGDGTFAPPDFFLPGITIAAGVVVAADVNGDGWNDLAFANGNIISVAINGGNGTSFNQSNVPIQSGSSVSSLAVGDLNGDGKPDLAFGATSTTGLLTVALVGNGDGTFQPAPSVASDARGNAVAIGDVNEDGRLDLALTDGSNVKVLINLGKTAPPRTIIGPGAAANANGWYNSPVQLTLSASAGKGVAETRCALDPATPPASFDTLPPGNCIVSSVTTEGRHTFYVASADLAGIEEAVQSLPIKIDTTPPTIAGSRSPRPNSRGAGTIPILRLTSPARMAYRA